MSLPEKLLVANRGEIACRVIHTAKAMGIRTVAVYSTIDRHALHVTMADESVCIGDAPAKDSYLRIDRVIDACASTGASAVHPGYGFLSENAAFARACADADVTFIGPTPSAIEAMGSKSAAKTLMGEAGVPLIPGYHGEDQSDDCLRDAAESLGYPVLLKAAAGGGGKGMRLVNESSEFDEALASARRESMAAFDDEKMLVEKYLQAPRHVEIQVFCDQHDGAVYLFERDCSVQRRHQKVLEEAPAPGMTAELRERMGEAAVKAARAINYRGAGTVEFLLDANGEFYFMEMNTRLQVEHPVPERISGQDLVEWQIRVASGEPLPLQQSDLRLKGHAIEARIYAEDPDNGFLPATGVLRSYQPPAQHAGLRIDSGVCEGDEVSMYYDPLIAKLICHAASRDQACQALADALAQFHIQGLPTNRTFLYDLVTSKPFLEAELETGFIATHEQILFHGKGKDLAVRLALG